MQKNLSVYLDGLRILAAATVFVGHLSWQSLTGGFLWQTQPYGHSAVVVFFVLSGFVIGYVADRKEDTFFAYSVARFARLYSVVLPAIILTMACDWIGTRHDAALYSTSSETEPLLRAGLGLTFLTQSWQKVRLFSNNAFWSLPYEFWYYQLFAAARYFRGWRRYLIGAVCGLIAGPAILLYFPIWLMGVAAYAAVRSSRRIPWALPVWLLTAMGTVIVIAKSGSAADLPDFYLPPSISPADYLLGILLALNIVAASRLNFGLTRLHRPIATAAGMTFALYLFHLPLLYLAAAFMPANLSVPERGLIAGGATLIAIVLLSFVTEGQKKRWRQFFRSLFRLLGWRIRVPAHG